MMTAEEIIQSGLNRFGPQIALSTSMQKGGIIVLDIASRLNRHLRVFTLDTGRLPEDTYTMIESIRKRYSIHVEMIYPDAVETGRMVKIHGPNLFLNDAPSRMLCCQVRKVRPMARMLARGVEAVLTGLRRDQSESRETVEQIDESGPVVKINPLAYWSSEEIDRYTELHELPVHPLYAKGYTSIGCEPCTRATSTGEDARAGRWWWEDGGKECGIHFTPDGRTQRTVDVMVNEITRNG